MQLRLKDIDKMLVAGIQEGDLSLQLSMSLIIQISKT